MANRPTKFERDLADLHGDADVEIIEMEPADGRRRYKVVSQPSAKPDPLAFLPQPLREITRVVIGLGLIGYILLCLVTGGLFLWAFFFFAGLLVDLFK